MTQYEPRTDRVQALADILHLALCCHSSKTRAPIANSPNSAQLQGIPYHSPNLHPGLCSSVGMRQETDRHTPTSVTNRHFASSTTYTKCCEIYIVHLHQSTNFLNAHHSQPWVCGWCVCVCCSDDSLGYEYPFTLKAVQKDGCTCTWCPWYRYHQFTSHIYHIILGAVDSLQASV